jgi:hypothetical protein
MVGSTCKRKPMTTDNSTDRVMPAPPAFKARVQ